MSGEPRAETPIRPAATVVALRQAAVPEMLLLKRSRGLAFMPDLWVFPGGRVDDADVSEGQRVGQDPFCIAAIRETAEEASLELVGGAASLVEFACWITPKHEKRRYHTRFFLGEVAPDAVVTPDASEVVDVRWLSASAALQEHRAGRLALAPPTWWTLFEMQSLHSVAAARAWAMDRAARPITPIEPSLAMVNGQPSVRWAHGCGLRLCQGVDGPFWDRIDSGHPEV